MKKKKIYEFFNKIELKKLNINFRFQNIKIGEQAIAACYRFLGKPVFENEIEEEIKKKFFVSAAITVVALSKLLKKKNSTLFSVIMGYMFLTVL